MRHLRKAERRHLDVHARQHRRGWTWAGDGEAWVVAGEAWVVMGEAWVVGRGWSRVVKGADEGIVHCGQAGRYSPLASPVRGGLGLTGTSGRTEGGLSDEVVERSEEDSPSRSDNMGSEARFAELAANPQEAFSVRCGVGGGTEERRDSPLATQRAYGSPRATRAVLGGSHEGLRGRGGHPRAPKPPRPAV